MVHLHASTDHIHTASKFTFFSKDHFPRASSWSVSYTHNLSKLNLSEFKLNKCRIFLLSSIVWPPNPSICPNPLLQIICQSLPWNFKTSLPWPKTNPFVPNFSVLEKDASAFPVLKTIIPSFKDSYSKHKLQVMVNARPNEHWQLVILTFLTSSSNAAANTDSYTLHKR